MPQATDERARLQIAVLGQMHENVFEHVLGHAGERALDHRLVVVDDRAAQRDRHAVAVGQFHSLGRIR